MKVIKQSITIKTDPSVIWDFLVTLDKGDGLKRWHPDHISLKILRGDLQTKGSIFYFIEILGKKKVITLCQITKVMKERYIEYALPTPFSFLYIAKGYCKITPVSKHHTTFTIYLHFGYKIAIIGDLLDWLIERCIAKEADIVFHTREELVILKKILEN